MGNGEKDLSVREATIVALESSKAGIDDLKALFKKTAAAFDSGDDKTALNLIGSELIPKIKAFFGFFSSIVTTNGDVLDPSVAEKLSGLFERSNAVMKSLSKETEAKNYSEVGDLLRFDFSDLVSEYGSILDKVSENFKSSTKAALEER